MTSFETGTPTGRDGPPNPFRRFVVIALVAPATLAAAAFVVQLGLLSNAPHQVAVHWGPDGAADGFAPRWTYPAMTVLFAMVLPTALLLPVLPDLRRGADASKFRFAAALCAGISVMLSALLTWLLAMQSGMSDPTEPSTVALPLIGSAILALAAGAAAWFAVPKGEASADSDPVDPLKLAPGEVAVWMQTITLSTPFTIVVATSTVVLFGLAIVQWFTGSALSASVATVIALFVPALMAVTLIFHVQVGASGLTARSGLGVFRFHVPVDDIEAVAAVHVNAMGEFGGVGIRKAPGRFGIVMRSGEALELTRGNGQRFLVTVDDPDTAAALLQAHMTSHPPELA